MTEDHNQELKSPPKKMSRRNFLRAGLGVGAGVLLTALPDKYGNNIIGRILSTTAVSLLARDVEANARVTETRLMQEAGEKGNPNYQPFLQTLESGIDDFQSRNPNLEVVWEVNPNYIGNYSFARHLLEPIKSGELTDARYDGNPLLSLLVANESTHLTGYSAYNVFYKRLPEEVQSAVYTADMQHPIFPKTRLRAEVGQTGKRLTAEEVNKIDAHYSEMKRDIEAIYENESRKPLPISRILTYLLEKNEGGLQPALGDMAGLFKYVTRGYGLREGQQLEWAQTHIQDQVNKNFSLNNIPVTKEMPPETIDLVMSVWGLIYHIPHMVYLPSYLSPDVVRGSAMYEFLSHPHVAHGYKMQVDAQAADSLNDIFAYLQGFS